MIFRDDDVTPRYSLALLERVNAVFETANVPVTLGIIPNFDGNLTIDANHDMIEYLREILSQKSSLYEAALHGLTHLNLAGSVSNASEFADDRLNARKNSFGKVSRSCILSFLQFR